MRSYHEWRNATLEAVGDATVVSPQDRDHTIQQNGGRETLRGLPKENRPTPLLQAHSNPEVVGAQRELTDISQKFTHILARIQQSDGFRQYNKRILQLAATVQDGIGNISILLTKDQEGDERTARNQQY